MKTGSVVHILMIVAVGLLGLAPAVVCAMPPDCPMTQSQASAHDCCLPAGQDQPMEGMTTAPCHTTQTAATPAPSPAAFHGVPSLSVVATALLDAPAAFAGFTPAATPVAAVPRFLLTHTFRL